MSQFTILAVFIAIIMTLLFLYSDNKIFSDNINYVAKYLSKLIIYWDYFFFSLYDKSIYVYRDFSGITNGVLIFE